MILILIMELSRPFSSGCAGCSEQNWVRENRSLGLECLLYKNFGYCLVLLQKIEALTR